MISESEIIRRIRISDLGSANKSYADELIEKYKIAAKTRLKHPTLTQKWTIDNQKQIHLEPTHTYVQWTNKIRGQIPCPNQSEGFLNYLVVCYYT